MGKFPDRNRCLTNSIIFPPEIAYFYLLVCKPPPPHLQLSALATVITIFYLLAEFQMFFSVVRDEVYLFSLILTAILAFTAVILISDLLGLHIYLGKWEKTSLCHNY